MATRINGIKYNLGQLTDYELDALLNMAADRIANAQSDIEKLQQEQLTRANHRLTI